MWTTTSLRGLMMADLRVDVLSEAVHSVRANRTQILRSDAADDAAPTVTAWRDELESNRTALLSSRYLCFVCACINIVIMHDDCVLFSI